MTISTLSERAIDRLLPHVSILMCGVCVSARSLRLAFLLADALVFDDVFVVEGFQDVDLRRQVVALLLSVLGL